MASQSPPATVRINIAVDVPISAVSAIRNATNNAARVAAVATITTNAGCATIQAIQTPQTRASSELHLLALPEELRNRIWHFAVVSSNQIAVSRKIVDTKRGFTRPAYSFPGLFASCKQIRSEAAPIYFKQNLFLGYVTSYDGAWLAKWTDIAFGMMEPDDQMRSQLCSATSPAAKNSLRLNTFHGDQGGKSCWRVFEKWLRDFHEGRGIRLPETRSRRPDTERTIAERAFNIVEKMRNCDWVVVAQVLREYRAALVKNEGRPLWDLLR